jgi:DNA polymerase-1
MSFGDLQPIADSSRLLVAVPIDPPDDAFRAPRALLISDGKHDEVFELDEPDHSLVSLRQRLLNPTNVVLFADAKPALRRLLAAELDIARPICLKTLGALKWPNESNDELLKAKTKDDAAQIASKALADLDRTLNLVEEMGAKKLARLESLVLRAFAAMEHRGLYVDGSAWKKLVGTAEQKMIEAKAQALKLLAPTQAKDLFGGISLNLDNGKEVKEALENLLGESLKDTNQHTLSRICHPAVMALTSYREAAKLVQTYGESFMAHIRPATSRIHATFETLGTSTGRVACHTPNLQNLPSDASFHQCVVAPAGKVLITADYAACELRILASLSRDQTFIDAFSQDADLHSEVAARMFGVPVDKNQNSELRQRAKAINFGLMYGMGHRSLAKSLDISELEAEQLFEQYFKTYPGIKRYLDQCVDQALAQGYAQTVLGRRLVFDEAVLKGSNARGELSRIAKNMPIQGTGAEIAKLAMLRLHERLTLDYKEAFLVNMIHDELVVECLASDAESVAQAVQQEMEDAQASLIPNVKPKADVNVGISWEH